MKKPSQETTRNPPDPDRGRAGPGWVRLSATSGSTPHELVVGYDLTGPGAGTHSATLTLSGDGDTGTVEIQVQLVVPSSYRRILQIIPFNRSFLIAGGRAR